MTVMEPIRHSRRDPSMWPSILGVLIGSVIGVAAFAVILEVIR